MQLTKEKINLVEKFVMLLNEVSDKAENIADIVEEVDVTESGEVELKYQINENLYYIVDDEGFVRTEDKELVSEGKYPLMDGNVLVVDSSNKIVKTEPMTDEVIKENQPETPQIAMSEDEPIKEEEEKVVEDEVVEDEPIVIEMDKLEIEGVEYEVAPEVKAYFEKLISERDSKDVEIEDKDKELTMLRAKEIALKEQSQTKVELKGNIEKPSKDHLKKFDKYFK